MELTQNSVEYQAATPGARAKPRRRTRSSEWRAIMTTATMNLRPAATR